MALVRATAPTMTVNLPDLDLRLLRAFIVVAEELHFSRAAERLGIAQPPLSQQIRRLEDKVGCALFVRGTRKVHLTEAGRSLLTTAYRIFEQLGHGLEATRRAGRGETGRLRVAFPTSLTLTILPQIIRSYQNTYPAVDLELQEMPTAPQLEALRAGTIDVGFLREPTKDPDLDFETIFVEQFVAVLPKDHALARSRKFNVRDMAGENFIFFPRAIGSEAHDHMLDICREAGFEPRIVKRASEWQTIAALVEAGLGVSIAPACIMRVHLDNVTYRALPDRAHQTAVVMGRRADSSDPATRRFFEIAHEVSAQNNAQPKPAMHGKSKQPRKRRI